MDTIKLYIFDMNGTVANTPFIDKAPLAPLPGRKEKIAKLRAAGAICSIASNQGGVAFGFQTEKEANAEVAGLARELGIEHWQVAFGHPKPKYGYEEYGTPEALAMRKPAPGMLLALMQETGIEAEQTMMVGDRDEDRDAAAKAGCHFMWAKDFFAEPGELVAQVFSLYQQVGELLQDGFVDLCFNLNGAGSIGWRGLNQWVVWNDLKEAPAAIQARIEKHKKVAVPVVSSGAAKQSAVVTDDFDPFLDSDDLP